MVGPMDFTTNDEIGLLISGHERPPVILCQWHHPYYQRLLEHDLGMGKAMDVYMWSLHITGREKVHPAIWEAADRLEAEHGIVQTLPQEGPARRGSALREALQHGAGTQLGVRPAY